MAPETSDSAITRPSAASAPAAKGAPPARRFRPSQITILVTVAALGLNLAALAIVIVSVSSTQKEVLDHLRTNRAAIRSEKPTEPAVDRDGPNLVEELLATADELDRSGETDSARQVRAGAQRLLIAKNAEVGAFDYAVRLLEGGHPREARRALYRILARADQPGSQWGELAARARFLIGQTLADEANLIETREGGDS